MTFMRNDFLTLLFILLMFGPAMAHTDELSQVVIRDKEFAVTKTLQSSQDLKYFSEIWESKTKVAPGDRTWSFKFDLKPGDRWLYDPTGWTRPLTMKAGSDYRISNSVEFNKLLGIKDLPERDKSK